MTPRPEWFDEAICKGQTDLFYQDYNERPQARIKREQKALAICRQCPVIAQCRQYGRDNGEYGIWGGETEDERYRLGYISRGSKKTKKVILKDTTNSEDQ